ncbi:MAG: 50S ribosomal protein L25 [Pedosphaera sp.]|nr:50S ribosomal protein L25 [Pedosphaera sp.]
MKAVPLNAFGRESKKRIQVKKLRTSGRVPAVIYGHNRKSEILEVVQRELEVLIHHSHSENLLIDLSVAGKNRLALLQEVQHHPLTGKFLHVDFHEVAPDELVTIHVPIEKMGEPEGVKTGGGVLENALFKVRVRGLPKDLPEVLHVDVTHMQLNQTMHLGDLKAPAGTTILGDRHLPVFSVAEPTAAVEVTPAAEGAPAEPEMIREKKPAEGEAATDDKKDKKDKKAEPKAEEKKAEKKK